MFQPGEKLLNAVSGPQRARDGDGEDVDDAEQERVEDDEAEADTTKDWLKDAEKENETSQEQQPSNWETFENWDEPKMTSPHNPSRNTAAQSRKS